MNVLGNRNKYGTRGGSLTIWEALSYVSVGTLVRIRVDTDGNIYKGKHVWQHHIQTPHGVLEFLTLLNQNYGHMLKVYEIDTFSGEGISGIELRCV